MLAFWEINAFLHSKLFEEMASASSENAAFFLFSWLAFSEFQMDGLLTKHVASVQDDFVKNKGGNLSKPPSFHQSESNRTTPIEKVVKYTLYSGEPPQSNRFLIGLTLGHRIGCKGIVLKSSISSPKNQKSGSSKKYFTINLLQ